MSPVTSRSYGPLTPLHIQILTQRLDKSKSIYRVFTDPELMQKAQVREKNSPEASAFFHNTPGISMKEYLFIEIPLKDILIVRSDLIKLGFETGLADSSSDESLQANEYICPECNFIQTSIGMCPKHQISLIPYYEKTIYSKRLKDKKFLRWVFIIFLILAATMVFSIWNRN